MAHKTAKDKNEPYPVPTHLIFSVSAEEIKKRQRESPDQVEMDLPKPFRFDGVVADIPDYFFVLKTESGERHAQAQGALAKKLDALSRGIEMSAQSVVDALESLEKSDEGRLIASIEALKSLRLAPPRELAEASHEFRGETGIGQFLMNIVEVFSAMKKELGPLLHLIKYFRNSEKHTEAERKLTKVFTKAIQVWSTRHVFLPPNGGTDTFPHTTPIGTFQVSLPWLAIEVTRLYVEQNLQLPGKGLIRRALIKLHPSLSEKRFKDWTKVYEAAGLSDLKKTRSWSGPVAKKRRFTKNVLPSKRKNLREGL